MKIKEIEYEYFKCFKKNNFQLNDLTLITGANSSGKSSLIYGFLGAIQSGEFPYKFSPNGPYVNMGDFTELSYLHSKDHKVKINLKLEIYPYDNLEIETTWIEDKVSKIPTLYHLSIESENFVISISKNKKYTLEYRLKEIEHKKHRFDSGEFMLELQSLIGKTLSDSSEDSNSEEDSIDSLFKLTEEKVKDRRKYIKFTFSDFQELERLTLEKGNYSLQSELRASLRGFNQIEKEINFISSFRLYPQRTYYEKSKDNFKVGRFGENYEDQIIHWQTTNDPNYKELVRVLKKLRLLDNLESKRLEGGRFELVVTIKKNGIPSSINDVGFGISQFLPIIVADIQLGKGSTLIIAQPEIHLHPDIQSKMADYFIENIKKNNKRYIIETHSEYLLNRVRYNVVKKKISSENLKVLFLSNSGKNVKSHDLEFTTKGEIKNAPAGFFKTYMIDVMNIANNISHE